jgi:hypothetical protein
MKAILLLLTLVTTVTVGAVDKIEGAFGLKLGDVFEPKTPAVSATPITNSFSLNGAYQFTPKEPNKIFSEYYVFITPGSNLIWGIAALHKQAGDHSGCDALVHSLMGMLYLKYEGKFDEHSRLDGSSIGQGMNGARTVGITTFSASNQDCSFAILYSDKELANRANQEREQNRVKEISQSIKSLDPTGL